VRGLMRHARIVKISVGVDAFAIETRENRGGRSPVKTFVVETNSNFQ
jgi:hypothetical protein